MKALMMLVIENKKEIDVISGLFDYSLGVKLIFLLVILTPIILWFIFGKNSSFSKTLSTYPPKGLNSVELAYLYKGFLTPKDAGSIILYFANRGVITFKEEKKGFKLIKVKELGTEKRMERAVMANLFLIDKETTEKELKTYFIKSYKDIDASLDTDETKIKMFLNSTLRLRPINKILAFLAIFVLNLLFTTLVIQVLPNIALIYSLFFILLFVCIIISLNPIGYRIKATMQNVKISLGLFYFITICILLYEKCLVLILMYILIIAYSVTVIYLSDHMNKRNNKANKFLGRILGFKDFLKNASYEELNNILQTDKNYMYEMLPFACVLNVEKIWIDKCFEVNLKAPYWYEGKWDKQSVLMNLRKIKNLVGSDNTYIQRREY